MTMAMTDCPLAFALRDRYVTCLFVCDAIDRQGTGTGQGRAPPVFFCHLKLRSKQGLSCTAAAVYVHTKQKIVCFF
jgi:hypothetical protein